MWVHAIMNVSPFLSTSFSIFCYNSKTLFILIIISLIISMICPISSIIPRQWSLIRRMARIVVHGQYFFFFLVMSLALTTWVLAIFQGTSFQQQHSASPIRYLDLSFTKISIDLIKSEYYKCQVIADFGSLKMAVLKDHIQQWWKNLTQLVLTQLF